MKIELIHTLTENFEAHAQKTEEGIEFWLARDLHIPILNHHLLLK